MLKCKRSGTKKKPIPKSKCYCLTTQLLIAEPQTGKNKVYGVLFATGNQTFVNNLQLPEQPLSGAV